MILTIIIAFFSLITLIIIHELGHFLTAKKFGIKVEEFGIGYPPRVFGKKIGETIYSLNILPFGAFVKIYGHEKRIKGDKRSFSEKPIWQRILVVLGGVITFWIVSVILLSIVMMLGAPTVISDEETAGLIDPKVQIAGISRNSPAQEAGLEVGDSIKKFSIFNLQFTIDKVKQVQDLTEEYKGQKVVLTIQRGRDVFDVPIIPRENPPSGEGAMGVGLLRTALRAYPWYQAPVQGILATGQLTLTIFYGWKTALASLFSGNGLPAGMEVRGPVGIFELFVQASGMGLSYFLQFIAIISISLAILNVLPVPALDGGWFALLVLEGIRGKPIKQKTEQIISSAFFFLLVALMIWVTVKDVIRIF